MRSPSTPWIATWLVCATVSTATADDTRHDKRTPPGAAGAPITFVTTQRLGAGYDANPALSPPAEVRRTNPDAAAVEDFGDRALTGGEANFDAFVGAPWWAGLALDLDGRWYAPGVDHEGRFDTQLGLSGGWAGPHAEAVLTLGGERYLASFGADDVWSASTELRGLWKPVACWQFGAQARGGARAYDAGEQRDVGGGGGLDVACRSDDAHALVGFDLDRKDSTEPVAVRTELSPRFGAGLTRDLWSVEARYFLIDRVYDVPDQDEIEHLVRIDLAWWPVAWIGPFLRGEVGLARGEANALAYDRWAVFGGVAARVEATPTARAAARRALERQGPATLVDGRVRFRFFLPNARRAAVIGTFNGWDADDGELTAMGGGWFEATRSLPAGRHRYHLIVDGRPTRPSGAPAYAPDGLGGEDAVVTVPGPND